MEWWRVALGNKPTYAGGSRVVCGDCLRDKKLTVLNRVFGASQACAECGKTDLKEEKR